MLDVLSELRQTYGDIFKPGLIGAAIVVKPDAVALRTTENDAVRGEQRIVDMDLGFIWGDEEPWFPVSESARFNADRLLALGAFSLIMTTDLVREEEARQIDRAENPIYQHDHKSSGSSALEEPPF